MSNQNKKSTSGAALVAAGILLSRIAGLIRERVFAHYFGNSWAGDAFKAALKIPNFLQNLFGEGVLSASFIPVYAKLRASKDEIGAQNLAWAVGSVLMVFISILVVVGIWITPWMIDLIAPGFEGERKELTIQLVQIFFPGLGLLVMSAWCLGVLNSHRQFFLSYSAPVLWNLTMIFFMVYFGPQSKDLGELARLLGWGLVLGSFFQFTIQLPRVIQLIGLFKKDFLKEKNHLKTVLHQFLPILTSRGVVQISAYIDSMMASYLPLGAVSSLAYAQTLYLLPISLFGMSVSAAELPAMSEMQSDQKDLLKIRLEKALRQVAFFVIPSAMAFLVLGKSVVTVIFRTGQFQESETFSVWIVLAGATLGLLASTWGRLFSSTFYSQQDSKTPLKMAIVRVTLTGVLGYIGAFIIPRWWGLEAHWGTVGLTASAGLAGWVECLLLKKALEKKIGPITNHFLFQIKIWGLALICSGIALGAGVYLLKDCNFFILNLGQLLIYGFLFLIAAILLKIPETQGLLRRLKK